MGDIAGSNFRHGVEVDVYCGQPAHRFGLGFQRRCDLAFFHASLLGGNDQCAEPILELAGGSGLRRLLRNCVQLLEYLHGWFPFGFLNSARFSPDFTRRLSTDRTSRP